MFYEEYILYPEEEDPRAEYVSDELKIYYYIYIELNHIQYYADSIINS